MWCSIFHFIQFSNNLLFHFSTNKENLNINWILKIFIFLHFNQNNTLFNSWWKTNICLFFLMIYWKHCSCYCSKPWIFNFCNRCSFQMLTIISQYKLNGLITCQFLVHSNNIVKHLLQSQFIKYNTEFLK